MITRQRINQGNVVEVRTRVVHVEQAGRVQVRRGNEIVGDQPIDGAALFPSPDPSTYPLVTNVYTSNTSRFAGGDPDGVLWFLHQRGLPLPTKDEVFGNGGLCVMIDERVVLPEAEVFFAGDGDGGARANLPRAWGTGKLAALLAKHRPPVVELLWGSFVVSLAVGCLVGFGLALASSQL